MNNNLAENLKKIRKENNLSQEQLAEGLGVSRQAISKWESKSAYPEMDKIIALCDKFNLNIDDLLHKDIKEVKGEEVAKGNLHNYFDDFFKFITDSIDLFCKMSFKSKIKLILEEIIIILILLCFGFIVVNLSHELFRTIFIFLPDKLLYFLLNIINCVISLAFVITSIIILVKVFKKRYLDYYDDLKKEVIKEVKNDEEINNLDKENKINLKKKESKIIIRDPKNSEYHFLDFLFKFIIGMLKFFSLFIAFFLSISLIFLLMSLVLTILLYKTGWFFIGLLGIILALGVINLILLLIVINFIFNRLNNKKQMIFTFLGSLIILGISVGLLFIGSLDFNVIEMPKEMYITETKEINMQDNLFFISYDSNIKYIESNIDNIKIEYDIYKYCSINYNNIYYNDIYYNGIYYNGYAIWSECHNYSKIIKDYLDKLNNKIILVNDEQIKEIRIYANQENIRKLKNNYFKYFNYNYEEE